MDFLPFSNRSVGQVEIPEHNNCFLIDWLTFVVFDLEPADVKSMLHMSDVPWQDEVKFRNGYPLQSYFAGVTISYGADQEEYYKDPSLARSDMGVCVNFSGQGCRSFETYGAGDWFSLFSYFFSGAPVHVTRLDLAYDDHTGLLDIYELESDTRDRNYVSRSKYNEIVWSDNEMLDIRGLTINIGSPRSDTKIRIYDKAAERHFKGRHWIRVELQLRHDNAQVACSEIIKQNHIGRVFLGVLRNYLSYRVPTSDTNKSRWPVAPYWSRLLLDIERISLWISPGEPYNFSKTEKWLKDQVAASLITAIRIDRFEDLIRDMQRLYTLKQLPPKYQTIIHEYHLRKQMELGFLEVFPDEQ